MVNSAATMNRADLQQLSDIRLAEAKVLLDNGSYPGAYYLAGYAVECAIKAYIAKQTNQYDFPDKDLAQKVYTHSLESLIRAAGLRTELEQEEKADNAFSGNWGHVSKWSEKHRYDLTKDEKDARELYTAITDANHGVLAWLKKRW